MTLQEGFAHFHLKREDRTRADGYDVYTPPFELLTRGVAPLEKQLRVFVNDTEYDLLDRTRLVRQTENYWTFTEETTATGGIACWGVRLTFDPFGSGGGDDKELTLVALFDENGDHITLDGDWSILGELGDTDDDVEFTDDVFDLDETTNNTFSGPNSVTAAIRFPRKLIISTVGWNSRGAGVQTADVIQNMEFEANIGTLSSPVWVSMGSNLTQDVGNSQNNHVAGGTLDSQDYPVPSGVTAENIIDQVITLSVQTADIGGTIPPVVTLSAELTNLSDRITMIRETRQDRPWVEPIGASLAQPDQFMVYFDQLRFIAQELCELVTMANLFTLGIADFMLNPFTDPSTIAQFHLNRGGSSVGPFSYSTIELLTGIPGADADDRHQIIVEVGDQIDGTSTDWTTLTFDATPADETEYSVDSTANTITLGDVENNDLRIIRQTKTTEWWYDSRDGQPGWNSLAIGVMQTQARTMLEEACFLPQFYLEAPLSNSIFPRVWNWFIFVGTRNKWTIPGGIWGGTGSVTIFVNNIEQTEGVEYTIEWPVIHWIISPPGPTDTTEIGVGGGFGGVNMGGGGTGTETPPTILPPPEPTPPVEYPPNNLDPDLGFTMTVGATPSSVLAIASGAGWEGDFAVIFSAGNALTSEFSAHLLRVEFTVTLADTIPANGGGFYSVGATEILYIGSKCGGTVFRNAIAHKLEAIDPFTSAQGSVALGCGQPGGALGGLDILANANPDVTSLSPASLRMIDRLYDDVVRVGETDLSDQIPFFQQWKNLRDDSISAKTAGIVTESGFTDDQWNTYLDPDTTLTDFDIPPP